MTRGVASALRMDPRTLTMDGELVGRSLGRTSLRARAVDHPAFRSPPRIPRVVRRFVSSVPSPPRDLPLLLFHRLHIVHQCHYRVLPHRAVHFYRRVWRHRLLEPQRAVLSGIKGSSVPTASRNPPPVRPQPGDAAVDSKCLVGVSTAGEWGGVVAAPPWRRRDGHVVEPRPAAPAWPRAWASWRLERSSRAERGGARRRYASIYGRERILAGGGPRGPPRPPTPRKLPWAVRLGMPREGKLTAPD